LNLNTGCRVRQEGKFGSNPEWAAQGQYWMEGEAGKTLGRGGKKNMVVGGLKRWGWCRRTLSLLQSVSGGVGGGWGTNSPSSIIHEKGRYGAGINQKILFGVLVIW